MLEQVPVLSTTALDLTYVLYNEKSTVSHVLALVTLVPILLNPAYAALAIWTRELLFFEMWAGQMLCEALNYVLKHIIRQERPNVNMGSGHGFPSSHSQWMGYFTAFLICHFTFRHRFFSTGWRLLDLIRAAMINLGIVAVSLAVVYSRYYLTYHTIPQVVWGFCIGLLFGAFYYATVEFIPEHYPLSSLAKARRWILSNPVSTWCRLRDGWAVYPDSGIEAQWNEWRRRFDALSAQQYDHIKGKKSQ